MNKSDEINLIGSGTIVNGDVVCDGDIRVDGKLNGSIKTKGKVVVGSTGLIDGDVECKNAEVSGELKAKITVTELLVLKTQAKLDGDITTNKLAIEPGASFSGSCRMGAVIKNLKTKLENRQHEKPKTA
mgnify:FL=1|tara:strand:+ start:421 stop:807 length:387 start_codon:yes stop_codon:yes gene_type:complete